MVMGVTGAVVASIIISTHINVSVKGAEKRSTSAFSGYFIVKLIFAFYNRIIIFH